jgi:hypothetical protein
MSGIVGNYGVDNTTYIIYNLYEQINVVGADW